MWLALLLRLADAAAPAGDAATDAAAHTGKPVCVRQGTRGEGWAWPDGSFIHWSKCKGVAPVCRSKGAEGEGWYDRGRLIAAASCSKPAPKAKARPGR